jgi:hypothetical protein
VVAWLVNHQVGTVVVGDPKGITTRDCGHRQNLALRNWRRTHLLGCLSDKAEFARIGVVLVNERGTSSTCPECHRAVPRPRGRCFCCPHCGHRCHRDLVGARNIAARGGGSTRAPARVTHRRAGRPPARRDRRRHLFDVRRSCPAPGRPGRPGSRSQGAVQEPRLRLRGWSMPSGTAPCEDRGGPAWTCVGSMRGCTSYGNVADHPNTHRD